MNTSDIHGDLLKVLIRNRDSVVFEGEAKAVTAINDKGIFDVLPEHANFIAIIKNTITLHKSDNSELPLPIKSGVIRVNSNEVHIFLDLISG